MADKDKKKLKVILKLPKSHQKFPATAPLQGGTQSGANSSAPAFSTPSHFSASQDHRKIVQSHHGAVASSLGLLAQSASGAFNSSVRSTSTSVSAPSPAPLAHVSSPNHPLTPPKKRKFKTVEQSGALGVGALVVGSGGVSEVVAAGKDEGIKSAGAATAAAVGGASSPAPLPPPVKKSHKKQVKPEAKIDAPPPNVLPGSSAYLHVSSQPLSKVLLEGVLDKLQKKDTYGVFAEPVDATQVPDYYDVIKDPMDFGTMRKKINKGSYGTIESFEADIYLICGNAMRYNGPDTIYYKQARAIKDMARRALESIRSQLAGEIRKPVSHKKKPPPPKKPHSKKPTPSKVRFDVAGSDFASGATLAGDGEVGGWSNSTVDAGKAKKGASMEKLVGMGEDSESAWAFQTGPTEVKVDAQDEPSGVAARPMGPKDGRRPLSTDEYHRNTYKPRLLPAHGQGPPLAAVGGELRQLLPVGSQVEHAYSKSLAQFGAILSPTAWRFVARKLQKVIAPNTPFGPGWIGEPGVSVELKKPLVVNAPSQTPQSVQLVVGCNTASTLETASVPSPTGVLPRAAAPVKSSSPAVLAGASPVSSPALPKNAATNQASADRLSGSKAGPGYSSGSLGRSSSKASSNQTVISSLSKAAQTQSSISPSRSVEPVLSEMTSITAASVVSGTMANFSSAVSEQGHIMGAHSNYTVSGQSAPVTVPPPNFSPGTGQSDSTVVSNPGVSGQSAPMNTSGYSPVVGQSGSAGGQVPDYGSGVVQAGTSAIIPKSTGAPKSGPITGTLSSCSTVGVQQSSGAGALSNYSSAGVQAGSNSSMSGFSPGIAKSTLGGGTILSYSSGGSQSICIGPSTLYPSIVSQSGSGVSNVSSYGPAISKSGHGIGAVSSFNTTGLQSGLPEPNYSSGASQSGTAGVASMNYASGAGKLGSAVGNITAYQSAIGQAGLAVGTGYPMALSQPGLGGGVIPSFSSGVVQPSMVVIPGYSSAGSGQSALVTGGMSNFSCSPSQSGQGVGHSPSYPSGVGQMGVFDMKSEKVLQSRSQLGGLPGSISDMQARNGGSEEVMGAGIVHNTGVKQNRSIDGGSSSSDGTGGPRLVWTQQGPSGMSSQEQAARAMNLIVGAKGFTPSWNGSLPHGGTSYAFTPVTSSVNRGDVSLQANVQAWAQARVMGLAQQQVEVKQKISPAVQSFHPQTSQLKLPPSVPQLQPHMYGEYNVHSSRLPSHSTGSAQPNSSPQHLVQQVESGMAKSGGPELMVTLPLHSQSGMRQMGSMQPSSLQGSVHPRSMPPDLNVALQSPSALQSPPVQQTSTIANSQQPDLKLQL